MNPEFKIEVGKLYRTRDGHMARIYATDGGDPYWHKNEIHGAVLIHPLWIFQSWDRQGIAEPYDRPGTPMDIVSEWAELCADVDASKILPESPPTILPPANLEEDSSVGWSDAKYEQPDSEALVLACNIDYGWIRNAWYEDGEWYTTPNGGPIRVTHWMPLPELPNAGQDREAAVKKTLTAMPTIP